LQRDGVISEHAYEELVSEIDAALGEPVVTNSESQAAEEAELLSGTSSDI